jgi:hypothetical protein
MDLGRLNEAVSDLRQVLARDAERVEAEALLRTANRKLEEKQALRALAPARPRLASAPIGGPLHPSDQPPRSELEELLPAAAPLDREDLESAGRGLQTIYQGLHSLLRSAGTPEPPPE